jgi:pyridoxal phosphate enzyme (YggS family)
MSSSSSELSAEAAAAIASNYARIQSRVRELNPNAVLVSVSKTKTIKELQAAFDSGCRIFGENYVDELISKSALLPSAQFHFIGHLQTNKIAKLCRCANLAMIQTIDSITLANKVSQAWPTERIPLPVLIQVNTSAEQQKNGVLHSDGALLELANHIIEKCPNLRLAGFMTIGECCK